VAAGLQYTPERAALGGHPPRARFGRRGEHCERPREHLAAHRQ
jgi:hypothetical protein